jgi:hypothetical protein
MAMISDYTLDASLSILDTAANRIDICSAEPTTFTAATVTLTLGNGVPAIGSPVDRAASGGGRKVIASALGDTAVTATGTATHFAISDTVNSRLLATGALANPQAVALGNPFTLTTYDIGIPDAV